MSFSKVLICLICVIIISELKAQIPDTIIGLNDTNYFVITKKMDAYMLSIRDTASYRSAGDSSFEEDGDEVIYERWKRIWQSRIDGSGDMNIANKKMDEYKREGVSCSTNGNITQNENYRWKCLGPHNMDYASNLNVQNQGQVIAISGNPINTNSILCSGAGGGGIFKSNDGGLHWHNTTDDEGFSTFAFHSIKRISSSPNKIFASSLKDNPGPYALLAGNIPPYSGGIIYSEDDGETWTQIQDVSETPDPPFSGKPAILQLELSPAILPSPVTAYYLLKANRFVEVILSENTFSVAVPVEVSPLEIWSENYNDLAIGIVGTKEVFAISGVKGVYIASRTAGTLDPLEFNLVNNFSDLISNAPINDPSYVITPKRKIEIDFSQENIIIRVVYVDATDPNPLNHVGKSVVCYSSDLGLTWSTYQSIPQSKVAWYDVGFEVSKTNKQVIYTNFAGSTYICCADRGIRRSIDGGVTFAELPLYNAIRGLHTDVRCISICKSDPLGGYNDLVFYGNDGGPARLKDGASWEPINGDGLELGQYYGLGLNEQNVNELLAGAQDGSEGYYFNGNWTGKFRPGGDNGECIIDPNETNVKYIEANYVYYRYNNTSLGFTHSFPSPTGGGTPLCLWK